MPGATELSADALLNAVEAELHLRKSEWVFLRELRVGTGRHKAALQRLDAFALNCFPHLGMKRICYEVKLSRADFLCEMRQPLKRRIGMRFSNEFYFVTPAGLLALTDLPVECGLVEIAPGGGCRITVPAPWRDTPGPTWQFAAAMLRNQRRATSVPAPNPQQQRFEFSATAG
jgi:hypothetical protein